MRLIAILLALSLAMPAAANPDRWRAAWPNTDFTRSSVDFASIMSGGPPRDGIPALSDPGFIAVDAETRLDPNEPVIAVEIDGAEPRAYPLRYLTWHEIVNDEVAGVPIAVTFCPLCNSAITFDRRIADTTLTFGVSGMLRHSDMVMYDQETESWWQQAIGRGIIGQHMDTDLVTLPTWMESWEVFRARNPNGLVMDEPDWRRPYGSNPYVGYDSSARPFLYNGDMPPHDIAPLVRVVRVGDRAWPLTRLAEGGQITEDGVQLSWVAGQASALDTSRIGEGRDVGNIRVRDGQGADLPHDVMFAFAFHAFWPDGIWMLGQ